MNQRNWTAGERRKFARSMQLNGPTIMIGWAGLSLTRAVLPVLILFGFLGLAAYQAQAGGTHLGAAAFAGAGLAVSTVSSRDLREQRAKVVHDMHDIVDKAGGKLSAEDRTKWNALDKDQEELRQQIELLERDEFLGAEFKGKITRREPDPSAGAGQPDVEKRYHQAWVNFMKNGMYPDQHGFRGISDEDRTIMLKRTRILKPEEIEMRDLGTGGEGAYPGATAGFFVPVGFVERIEEAQKYVGPMWQTSEIMKTASGQPLPFPTDNDASIEGEFIGEGQPVNPQDVSLGQIMLGAFKVSTKLVKVSIELLQDSAFDLDTWLARKFGTRFGRVTNRKFTVGAGTTEPTGIVTAATASGQTVIGDDNAQTPDPTTEVGYSDFVNLEHSVDIAYRPGSAWMMNDLTIAFAKKLRDKYGRPLWMQGMAAGKPDTLLGYPFWPNNYMDSLAQTSPISARKTVLFGQLGKYLIRSVKDLAILRLVERYADYGQVAFIGFARVDGNLLDAGTHPVKYLTNPAS